MIHFQKLDYVLPREKPCRFEGKIWRQHRVKPFGPAVSTGLGKLCRSPRRRVGSGLSLRKASLVLYLAAQPETFSVEILNSRLPVRAKPVAQASVSLSLGRRAVTVSRDPKSLDAMIMIANRLARPGPRSLS